METKESETLVNFGSEVKAIGDGKVAGYLVRFTTEQDPDLTGDFFTKSTDFGDVSATPVLYHHGLDKTVGVRPFGKGQLKMDEVGIWIDAQLELADKYQQAVYKLVEQGKLGWSSGTASHLVRREETGKAWHVLSWPLGLDASLTPTPAEPRNDVVPLKSIEIKSLELEATEDPVKVVTETPITETVTETKEVKKMEDPKVDPKVEIPKVDENAELKAKVAAIEAKLAAPAIDPSGKRSTALNLKTKPGDDAYKAYDFYLRTGDKGALRNSETESIKTNYDFEEGTQYYGQEVVPTEIANKIYELRDPLSFARAGGCQVMPVGTVTVWLPKEGAHMDALTTTTEKGAYVSTTSKPLDKTIVTILKKTSYIFATEELLEDTVVDIPSYIGRRAAKALAVAENYMAYTALVADATVGVTTAAHATITAAEVVAQYYKLPAEYRDSVAWMMNGATEGYVRGLTGNWFNFVPTSAGNLTPGQPTGWLVDPASKVFNNTNFISYATAGANKTIFCSNLSACLVLCERRGLTIMRDPYTASSSGEIIFNVSARFQFGVVNTEANTYMTHPT
jgi:HK97 family phage major capsid protein